MTQESIRNNEWDPEDNTEDVSFIPASGQMTWTLGDMTTLSMGTNRVFYQASETNIQPNIIITSGTIDEYITPVAFDFHLVSWKYIFIFIFSIILMPALIIWSKFTGIPAGFRIRNR